MKTTIILFSVLCFGPAMGFADDDLKERLDDEHGQLMPDHWIYNDIPKGMRLAKETASRCSSLFAACLAKTAWASTPLLLPAASSWQI